MAGGYTYDEGVTIIPDLNQDTQPTGTILTSPCGKALQEKLLKAVPEPIKEEKV